MATNTIPEIVIHFRGTAAEVRAAIERALTTQDEPFRELLTRAGQAALHKIHEEFLRKSQGGTDQTGLRWQPLAPLTLVMRRKAHRQEKLFSYGTDILLATGALADSLDAQPPPSPQVMAVVNPVRYQIFRLSPRSVTIGTSRPFALVQHDGLAGKIPQRRLWPAPTHWTPAFWAPVVHQVVLALCQRIKEELDNAQRA